MKKIILSISLMAVIPFYANSMGSVEKDRALLNPSQKVTLENVLSLVNQVTVLNDSYSELINKYKTSEKDKAELIEDLNNLLNKYIVNNSDFTQSTE